MPSNRVKDAFQGCWRCLLYPIKCHTLLPYKAYLTLVEGILTTVKYIPLQTHPRSCYVGIAKSGKDCLTIIKQVEGRKNVAHKQHLKKMQFRTDILWSSAKWRGLCVSSPVMLLMRCGDYLVRFNTGNRKPREESSSLRQTQCRRLLHRNDPVLPVG